MGTRAVVSAVAASTALAAAGAAPASPGAGSVASADGASIYMISPQGGGGTIVTRLRGSDRTAQVKSRLEGSFEVPVVAGAEEGLSRDGSTLVLAGRPAGGVSRFALLDSRTLRTRRILTLHGSYSFDALSPNASTLYVIRYLSRDHSRYAVQGLDVGDSTPVAKTLVEKGEPGEAMAGTAVTRTTSPDGGWVYTLYDGKGGKPFVHALSTVDEFTVCIDLDNLAGRSDIGTMILRLRPKTHTLEVASAGSPVALVDTESFEASPPPRPAAAKPEAGEAEIPWLPIAALTFVVAVGASLIRRRVSGALRVRG